MGIVAVRLVFWNAAIRARTSVHSPRTLRSRSARPVVVGGAAPPSLRPLSPLPCNAAARPPRKARPFSFLNYAHWSAYVGRGGDRREASSSTTSESPLPASGETSRDERGGGVWRVLRRVWMSAPKNVQWATFKESAFLENVTRRSQIAVAVRPRRLQRLCAS